MTKIQQFLRSGRTLDDLKTEYAIKASRHGHYPNLVLLKYSQIDSPLLEAIVAECRGIVLDENDNWNIVARGFDKFFNYGEPGAVEIDWQTARVQEKVDGSLCLLYHYYGAWHVATTGTPDASGHVNTEAFTFHDLFFRLLSQSPKFDLSNCDVDHCFLFELTSPLNRIVVRQTQDRLTLLAIRNRVTGAYVALDSAYGTLVVREYSLQSIEAIQASFDVIDPLSQEGYVIVDGAGRRVKVKHPGYVALHHLKDAIAPKSFLEIARKGETAEIAAYFPELAVQIEYYDQLCDAFGIEVDATYAQLQQIESQKDFAAQATRFAYGQALFAIRAKKCASGRDFLAVTNVAVVMRLLNISPSPEDTPEAD